MRKMLTIASMVGLACIGRSASAALLTYDGFDYNPIGSNIAPVTNPGTNGLNGGTGWSSITTNTSATGNVMPNGTWQESNVSFTPVVASGLSYTDGLGHQLQVAGNAANINGTTHDGAIRALSDTYSSAALGAVAGGSTIWVSMLAQYSGTAPLTDNKYFELSLYNGTTASVVNIGKLNNTTGSNGGEWMVQGTAPAFSTKSVSDVSLLVLRIDFTSTTTTNLSLFVNPTLDGTIPTTPDATATRTAISFNALRIQGNGTGYMDELRLGNTFADVTPVPEPAALTVLGGLGLLSLSRRKRCPKTA